ncbi:MAG: NAD(P)H-flavin reductase [Kiritimatiellia bacterium]|jgi:NAD(P)H-flavin reductase
MNFRPPPIVPKPPFCSATICRHDYAAPTKPLVTAPGMVARTHRGNFMADYTLSETTVISARVSLLRFAEIPNEYSIPGQFLAVSVQDAKPSWFAIASSPGEPLELLIKAGGTVADSLCAMQVGEVATAGEAMGKGFAIQDRSRPLVCLINGTGVSAVRPVIRAELAAGLPRPVHLLYGVHFAEDFAFVDDMTAWKAAGVSVVQIVGAGGGDLQGLRGWVQDHAQGLGLVQDDVDLLLCGVREMAQAALALYSDAGLAADRVLTNY